MVIQQAQFDGLGRRIKKTVTNSGDSDGVTVYLYSGHQIIETRDGSGNVETQVYHGTRYIDEVVGLRVKDQGRVYLHQDANWNVTAMTDLTGRIIERYWYSPYGELEAVVAAHPFDYDDDGDVDNDDYAVTTNGTCSGAAAATGDCRRLDANADGVVNDDDRTVITAYIASLDGDTALQRVPISTYSRRGNYFGHQGLVLDAELASYQNRARQYAPKAKRFKQVDPLVHLLNHLDSMPRDVQLEVLLTEGRNPYSYEEQSAVRRLDPSGMTSCCYSTNALCSAAGGTTTNRCNCIPGSGTPISFRWKSSGIIGSVCWEKWAWACTVQERCWCTGCGAACPYGWNCLTVVWDPNILTATTITWEDPTGTGACTPPPPAPTGGPPTTFKCPC